MAKYKIIPSSRTIVQSPISIGHKAEKGVEAIEFDVTAWVETYGSGTLTVIMRRWGDAIPYPIALEIDENNKATWTLSDIDTAKAGMAYAQLSYIVGETVVKKSDIYTFRVMDSLTGEGEPPEAYESWLEHLTHLAAEAMAEVLDIEGIVTDKTLTVDGGIADAKKVGDELGAINESLGNLEDSLQSQTGIITKVNGSYISLITDPVSLTPVVDAAWSHSIVNCTEGDTFIINADGGQRPRAWGFLDSANHVISVADASTVVENLELTAPANATKLIINDRSGVASYKVGDNLISRITVIENENTGLTEESIIALLTCFEHVAWIDGNGRNYYNALENSFNLSTYPKIKAELAQSASVIYTDDDLDTLKSRLTVKYYTNRDDVGTEVIDSDYTLSGTLNEGNNTITVAYGVYRTKFIVQAVDYYNAHEVVYPDNNNKLRILSSHQLEGGYSGDSGAYIKHTSNRACLLSLKGRQSISNNQSSFVNSGYYPIPIPANATSVSITLSPSTLYAYVGIIKTSASKTTKYERLQDRNWSQSPISVNFSSGQDLGLVINLKTSNNSSVSVSGISVEFS